ncbi:DUF805 domain-containing protein [Rhodosalinus sp. FB01]|uniref:DUF805 domain-containing protein n=1 Tax=Rhodosalinus sp. FB01 TaxID=3239194 RepID=UPI003524FC2D
MSFADAVTTCLRKFATFSGRASRPEYWWFTLFVVGGSLALSVLDAALFGARAVEVAPGVIEYRSEGVLATGFFLVTLLPGLAAGWRRMHDSGRSGLHLLYPLIVMVGIGGFASVVSGLDAVLAGDLRAILFGASAIVMHVAFLIFLISPLIVVYWLTRPSEPGSNRFGPNPQEVRP